MPDILSENDVQRIARELASQLRVQPSISEGEAVILVQKTVQEMTVRGMEILGVNITNEDQATELAEDVRFVRGLRKRYQRAERTFTTAVINAFAAGFLLLLVWGLLSWVRGEGPQSAQQHILK